MQQILICRQVLTRRCSVCGHNSTESSESNLTYLDYNVHVFRRRKPDYRDRIAAALTLGWCPICGHHISDDELEAVAERAAAFYGKQKRRKRR